MARGNIVDRRGADDGEEIIFSDESINQIARYNGAKADRKKVSEDRAMKATKAASAAAQKTPFPVAPRVGGLPKFTTKSPDTQTGTAPESYFEEMSITERRKPAASSGQVFRVGSKGAEVGELQQFLKLKGLYAGEIDNDFGPQMKKAVEKFQRAAGLEDDGVIGENTLGALLPEMAKYVGPVQNEDMPAPSALPEDTKISRKDYMAMDDATKLRMRRSGVLSDEDLREMFDLSALPSS
tara:strand:+ start:4373 stop:5089 length:717 start_codon:yes stop_codon:yes gene_type:complete